MKKIFPVHIKRKGIAIYIAVTITAALILVSFSILSIAIKQINISSSGRDSQAAFYAADSGVECTLYWDLKNTTNPGFSAFATNTPLQTISCNNQSITVSRNVSSSNGNGTSTYTYNFAPDSYCVSITIAKKYVGEQPTTRIESRGYNSCDVNTQRRVERAILVSY